MKNMIRYFKWVLLVFLIICLIIIGIKFVNYDKENNKDNKYEFSMVNIYNFDWYMTGISIYKDNELINENMNLLSIHFMNFNKSKVVYCNTVDNKCDQYNYSYKDGKITIDSEDYFMANGVYDITLDNDILKLSIDDENTKYIYYFKYPEG